MAIKIFKRVKNERERQRGTATIEFAVLMFFFLMPLMFALLEASEAMTVNRRVAISVNTFADLTAQSETITKSELSALEKAARSMLEPQPTADMITTIVSVAVVNNRPEVRWSMRWSKEEPDGKPYYQTGERYDGLEDDRALDPGASLVIVEVEYPHTLLFVEFFDRLMTFNREAIRYPRLVDRVELCEDDLSVCIK